MRLKALLVNPIVPALSLALLFFILFSYYTIHKHFSFGSAAFDLGIYTQVTYLYSQGLTPFSTLKHMLLLGDHFGPILWLLSPFYLLHPQATTMLIIQALFVGFSVVPIYLVVYDKIKRHLLTALISLAYLVSPGIVSAIHFDFHLATISVLPLSLILYAWYFQKWRLYWVTFFLALLFKEDIPLFLFGLGAYQLFLKQKKIGFITMSFSALSFLLIKFFLMPFFWKGGGESYISTSVLPLTDPISLLLLLVSHPSVYLDQLFNAPVKMSTFYALHQPFAFLSLLSPLSWLTTFPGIFLRFSSNYSQMWTMNFHHNANVMPFLAVSAAFAFCRVKIPTAVVTFLLVFFLSTGSLSPTSLFWSIPWLRIDIQNYSTYMATISKYVPSQADLSVQSPLVPHLSNRDKIYLFPEILDAEYIVLDTTLNTYPFTPENFPIEIKNLLSSPYWEQINLTPKSNLLIFKRKLNSPQLAPRE